MDVDIEEVVKQFNVLSTSDKDALVAEFQSFVGEGDGAKQLVCEFFLEMANWNLQAALCAYYDNLAETSTIELRMASMETQEESGELIVAPHSVFRKGWRIRNTGARTWPVGCFLRFVSSSLRIVDNQSSYLSLPVQHESFATDGASASRTEPPSGITVPCVYPGCIYELSSAFISPPESGTYQYELKVCTATGNYFGDSLWLSLKVPPAAMASTNDNRIDTPFDVSAIRASLNSIALSRMPIEETEVTLAEHINLMQLGNTVEMQANISHVQPLINFASTSMNSTEDSLLARETNNNDKNGLISREVVDLSWQKWAVQENPEDDNW